MVLPVRILFLNYIISTLTFLGLLININAEVLQGSEIAIFGSHKGYYTVDLKNNTLVYADCNPCGGCECNVTLQIFTSNQKSQSTDCTVYLDGYRERSDYSFRLHYLNDNRVLLMGIEKGSVHPVEYKLFFFTINMSNCKSVPSKLEFQLGDGYSFMPIESYPIISYDDTFDVFFVNKSLCGDFLCRLIYDKDGNVIEGPVASYIPDALYSRMTFSVDPKSSSMGYFVATSDHKLHLIKTSYNTSVNLMGQLDDHYSMKTISSNDGLLGVCYKVNIFENNASTINCTQFNGEGVKILDTSIKIDYEPEEYASSYNLNNGTILLLTAEKSSLFYHLKKITVNHVENIYSFKEYDDSYIQTNFAVEKNANICMNLAYFRQPGRAYGYMNFKYTCITYN